jgi:hypothetical protein
VGGLRRVRAHQQPRARTIPLEARVTATLAPLGVVGGRKGLQDRECFTTCNPRWLLLVSDCCAQQSSTPRSDRLEALGQLCCRHAHPRHTKSVKRTSTMVTAAQRKNVYCERRGRGSSPIGRRCSMSKAPNEAQGPRCQSPSALLRPSGERTLDAVQDELVVVRPLQRRANLT